MISGNTALQPFNVKQIAPAADGVTYDLYLRFVRYCDAAPSTVETYTKAVRLFMRFLEDRQTTHPSREDVIDFRESLKAAGKKPATVQLYICAVRAFFQWMEDEGLYPNIANRVKGAKISNEHKKGYLTTAQVQTIAAGIDRSTVQGLRDYAIFALCVTAGLRTIEVSRANIEDLGTVGDSAVLFVQGKGQQERSEYVKLAPQVEKAIRRYLKKRGENDKKAPLFASVSNNSSGGRLSTRTISGNIKEAMRQAGYDSDRLTAHSLRHTAATLNLMNGGTLPETQQLLRHSDISTTMIYSHALERAANHSEERIANLIFT